MDENVSRRDKSRLIECYKRVQYVGPELDSSLCYNTSITGPKYTYVYRVNSDKTVSYLQKLENSKYTFVSFT